MHTAHQINSFLGQRIIRDHAHGPFVFLQRPVPVVSGKQAITLSEQFARQRQVLDIQQRLFDIFPTGDSSACCQIARFTVEALGLVVVASTDQRIGAVIGDACIERDAVIRHDAA